MNLYNRFKSIFSPTNIRPLKQGGAYWYPLEMSSVFGSDKDYIKYLKIPELANIINIRSRAMASGYLELVSKATGEPVKAYENLVKVLQDPNYFQSYSEFWRQSELFRVLYGNEYIYFNRPIGMPNSYKGMFTLNPSKVKVEYKGDKRYYLETTNENVFYYYLTDDGKKSELDKNNLIHLNDNRIDPDNPMLGVSKLEALRPALENMIKAYEKRGVVHSLPTGVFAMTQVDATGQPLPMVGDEQKEAQRKLQARKQYPIITNLPLSYENLNVNPSGMGLFEETREDMGKICDALGVPYEVLASQRGVTFSNLKEAKKQMYEQNVIPDVQEKVDALNMFIESNKKTFEIQAKFDHLAVFDEDKKQRAQSYTLMVNALSKAYADGAITLEEYRNELNQL